MRPHEFAKTVINELAGWFGVRVVSANWGPRGVRDLLERVKARGFSPALVFDVGAYDGRWTHECRTIFGEAQYVLIDPLEANRPPLEAMVRADRRVSYFHGVAGARDGTLALHEHGDQSSILVSSDFAGEKREVQATTVDRLFEVAGTAGPVLLKADVQGYELEVLKGAPRCLEATEMLVLEVSFRRIYAGSPLAHDIVAYVGERGFRLFEICSYLQRASDRDLLQSDFVFVRESSPLFGHHGWS